MFSGQHSGVTQTVINIYIFEFGESLDYYDPDNYSQFPSLEIGDLFIQRCLINIVKQLQTKNNNWKYVLVSTNITFV